MTQEEWIDKLIELVEQSIVVKKEDREYRDRHAEEHRFLRALIKKAEAEADDLRAIKARIVGGSIWAIVLVIVGSLVFTAKAHLLGKVI